MATPLDPADKKPGAANHRPPLIECGRDEMNLIDIPFTLAVRRATDLKVMPDCLKSKNAVVKGSEGIPLAYAEDVYIGLMALSRAQGFQERRVHFSQWGLLNLIGWPDDIKSYKRQEKALLQLKGITILHRNFWNPVVKKRSTLAFGLVDSFELIHEERGRKSADGSQTPRSWFKWNDIFFQSLRSGFVKVIDLERYKRLKSPTAKRLFRYLDKHFYQNEELSVDLFELIYDVLGWQGSYKHPSEIKRALKGGLEELIRDGFMEEPQYCSTDKGTAIVFRQLANPVVDLLPTPDPLRERLKALGMNPPQVEFCTAPENREKSVVVLEMMAGKAGIKNVPAYLYKLVRDGFLRPEGFESQKEKEEEKEAAERLRARIVSLVEKIREGRVRYFVPRRDKRCEIRHLNDSGQDPLCWTVTYWEEEGIYPAERNLFVRECSEEKFWE